MNPNLDQKPRDFLQTFPSSWSADCLSLSWQQSVREAEEALIAAVVCHAVSDMCLTLWPGHPHTHNAQCVCFWTKQEKTFTLDSFSSTNTYSLQHMFLTQSADCEFSLLFLKECLYLKKNKYCSLGLFRKTHNVFSPNTHTHYCRKHRYYYKHQRQALTHLCWHILHFTAYTHIHKKMCEVTTGKLKNVHHFHWCPQTSFIVDIQTPKQAFT